jgi:hypothetical protein
MLLEDRQGPLECVKHCLCSLSVASVNFMLASDFALAFNNPSTFGDVLLGEGKCAIHAAASSVFVPVRSSPVSSIAVRGEVVMVLGAA